MFEYRVDRSKSRFTLIFSVDFNHDGEAAHRGLHEAATQAKADTGYFDMIVDMTQVSVAPQYKAGSGGEMIAWCIENGLRRAAFVTESAVMKMQLNRLSGRSDQLAFFANSVAATRWPSTSTSTASGMSGSTNA